MVGVAGYDEPVSRHRARVRDHRPRPPVTRTTTFVADVLERSGLSRGAAGRPQRGRGPGPPRRRAARDHQLRGHRGEPIMPAHVASPRCSPARSPAPCAPHCSTRSGGTGCAPSSASSRSAAGSPSDLDRPRVVASVVDAARDLLEADAVEFSQPRRGWSLPRGAGASARPADRSGAIVVPGDGLCGRGSSRPANASIVDRRRWVARSGLGFPVRVAERPDRRPGRDARSRRPAVHRARAAHRRPARHPDRGRAPERRTPRPGVGGRGPRPADRAAQPPLLRRGGRDGVRRRRPERARRSASSSSTSTASARSTTIHGHAVGDAVLRRVARSMASVVRTGDIARSLRRRGIRGHRARRPMPRRRRHAGRADPRRGRPPRRAEADRRPRPSRSRSLPASRPGSATKPTGGRCSAPRIQHYWPRSAPAATGSSASRALSAPGSSSRAATNTLSSGKSPQRGASSPSGSPSGHWKIA